VSLTTDQLERFVAEIVADPEPWAPLIRHEPGSRTYELLHDDEHVNAWLICWSEDADTGFHDHDESAAAITVIDGHVREDRLCLAGQPRSRIAGPGEQLFVPPTAIHRVLHAGHGPAVTIHAYSPPLTRMGSYCVGPDGELQRLSQSYQQELKELV
jgi:quercetin dioxygenase-like cupin family protein